MRFLMVTNRAIAPALAKNSSQMIAMPAAGASGGGAQALRVDNPLLDQRAPIRFFYRHGDKTVPEQHISLRQFNHIYIKTR